MSSRDKILNAVAGNKPEYLPLTEWKWDSDTSNVVEKFTNTLTSIGGAVTVIKDLSFIRESLKEVSEKQKRIVSRVTSFDWNNNDHLASETAIELETIEVAIIEGEVGVAENGAIWVNEQAMGHRALPFICQHLIIVLPVASLVSNMHEAYSKINITAHGFGAFIAGPSKTADIEQSLVIGAHGARSLRVYLIEG